MFYFCYLDFISTDFDCFIVLKEYTAVILTFWIVLAEFNFASFISNFLVLSICGFRKGTSNFGTVTECVIKCCCICHFPFSLLQKELHDSEKVAAAAAWFFSWRPSTMQCSCNMWNASIKVLLHNNGFCNRAVNLMPNSPIVNRKKSN